MSNHFSFTFVADNFRPYLTSFQSNDNTDFINAVFVDVSALCDDHLLLNGIFLQGYTRSKEYIVTEWPLKRTLSDNWSLIYDHECNSVIILGEPPVVNVSGHM